MKVNLHFDYRDVFRAARLGLAGKKVWIQFCGILFGYIVYLIFNYVAFLSKGMNIGEIWKLFGLFPLPFLGFPWFGWVIFGVGAAIALAIWLLASSAVAKITYQELKGDDFYSVSDSLGFVKKNWKPVLFSPLTLIGMIVFFLAVGALIGLLAKVIPYVGEIGLSLIFGIPIVGAAVFTVFMAVVFLFSLILGPAIVATTGEDTFETVIQLFSTIWNQPWRLVVYQIVLKFTQFLAVGVMAWFTVKGLKVIHLVMGWSMGDKLDKLLASAAGLLPKFHLPILGESRLFPHFSTLWANLGNPGPMVWTMDVAGIIIGITLILIGFFIFAYGGAVINAGQTLIYLILRLKKDEENLLERKEEEEEEETFPEEEEKEKKEEKKEEEKVEGEEEAREPKKTEGEKKPKKEEEEKPKKEGKKKEGEKK